MTATLDATRTYRYRLTRHCPAMTPGSPALWVGLNPSTAAETTDDPTVRKLVGFQRHWAAAMREVPGNTELVNLFALRATDPKELRRHPDPVGPLTDTHIIDASREVVLAGGRIVVAWGAHPFARTRAAEVARIFANDGIRLWCLGTTKDGSPRHPLYVPYSQPLVLWKGYAS